MDSGAFLQSKEWGDFQASLGRRVERLSGERWSAQLIESKLPMGQSYWYCPKGPVGDAANSLAAITTFVSKQGGAFLRFEPAESVPEGIKTVDLQPADTLITDLTKSEDQLLAGMHHKTRYNIRVAEKHGVEINLNDTLADAWSLFEETARRDGFRLHERHYYESMLDRLRAGACRAFVATARYNGRVLAVNGMIDYGGMRTYLHGASSSDERNVMAPYLLHWALMRDAKVKGLKAYDWWGIAPEGSPKEKSWAGITRFKRGFGGTEVRSPGTFDLPIDHLKYRLYRFARNFIR